MSEHVSGLDANADDAREQVYHRMRALLGSLGEPSPACLEALLPDQRASRQVEK